MYFVRLHTEIAELSERLQQKKDELRKEVAPEFARVTPEIEPALDEKRVRQKANKKKVKDLVAAEDVDGLVALCFDDKKTLRLMQRQLYNPDENARWQIAWLISRVTNRVSTREPGQVSELIHRLFEACSDSAATPWGMIETLGYVIAGRTDIFGAFTRHLLNYMGDASTQLQVIWAMAEIAKTRPDLIRDTPFFNLFHYLEHPEPAFRGHAAMLLGRIKATEVGVQMLALNDDEAEFETRVEGKSVTTTVAEEAKKALVLIHGGKKDE